MNTNQSHGHSARTLEGITTGDSNAYIDTADPASPATERWGTVYIAPTNTDHIHGFSTGGASVNHSHPVDIAPFASGVGGASHAHSVTVSAAGGTPATQAHENKPPFIALSRMIKKA
jgi:hypothetical protein